MGLKFTFWTVFTILSLGVQSTVGLAQDDIDSSAAIKGTCKAELDGGDAGCSRGRQLSCHFKNGHDLINFPGTDPDAVGIRCVQAWPQQITQITFFQLTTFI